MNTLHNTYDVVIVGSGAGGSAAAYRLAGKGLRVLLLEKGPELPVDGSTLDIDKVMRQGFFKSKEPWLDGNGNTFVPEEYFNLGGKTKWYGAALLRFAPHEFDADPDFQCLPWPISYQDLSPYYDEAEQLLGVREFAPEPDISTIVARFTRNGAGWKAMPLPLALAPEIVSDPLEARHFDAFASVKGYKADAQHSLLARVKALPNLEIRTEERVTELLGAGGGVAQLSGVLTASGRVFKANTVLLAAGALHSPRLLQDYMEISGLAARLPCYRAVGRHFKRHILTALIAFSPTRKTDLLRKTVVLLNERFPHSSVQPLGFDAELISLLIPRAVPRIVARSLAERAYGFFLQTEDGSNTDNCVSNRVNGTRQPRLDYDPGRSPQAFHEHRELVKALQKSLLAAGLLGAAQAVPLAGTAHACGTLIAGTDPATSVVDSVGKVHGMKNLYVVDGSILPRSSRVNPSLTIYAWALRVADRLGEKL